jgi:hypothetical protein
MGFLALFNEERPHHGNWRPHRESRFCGRWRSLSGLTLRPRLDRFGAAVAPSTSASQAPLCPGP